MTLPSTLPSTLPRPARWCSTARHLARLVGRSPSDGYNLVALTVAVMVLNVAVAAVLPMWSTVMKREREEELIFRGLQYAEGIRIFQRRFGRAPVQLQELIEVEPRCMRKLWKDPMSESGEWGLIFATPGGQQRPPGQVPVPRQGQGQGQGQGDDPSNLPGPGPTTAPGTVEIPEVTSDLEGRRQGTVAFGPIEGVYSLSDESSLIVFMGEDSYRAWKFRAGLILGAAGGPPGGGVPGMQVGVPGAQGTGGPIQPGGGIPILNARWIGRALPEGIQPPGGGMPGSAGIGNPLANPGAGNRPNDPGIQRRRATLPNTLGTPSEQRQPQSPRP